MKRRAPHGYTILETMIFLAVTAAIFTMVALTMQGRSARTGFATAARELENQIADVINDIESGYYGAGDSFECDVTGPPGSETLTISDGTRPRGTNSDCVFLGKVLHFGVEGPEEGGVANNRRFNVLTVAGRRQVDGEYAASVPAAQLTIIPQITERRTLPVGLEFDRMRQVGGVVSPGASAVLLLSSSNFSMSAVGDTRLGAGALALQYMIALPASVPDGSHNTISNITTIVQDTRYHTVQNVAYGFAATGNRMEMCFDSDASNQHALYTMTLHGASNALDTTIGNGPCADLGW